MRKENTFTVYLQMSDSTKSSIMSYVLMGGEMYG